MGITANIDISTEQRKILLDLFSKHIPKTKVLAFGSRVKWTTRFNSDLDLVVFSSSEQSNQVSALKEALEESNLPFRVDLLVWDNLPENFQRNIEEGYVVLVGRNLGPDEITRSNWKRLPVTEVCTLIVDCVNKTAPNVDHVTPYKMIRTPNIKGGRVNVADCRYVEKDVFDKWTRRASVENDDVLLTREAPMGEVGIVNTKENIFLGQRIVQYRANKNVMNPRFLLYSFLSNDLQNQFRAHEGSGSVVSHIRVQDCLKFEMNVPPLEVQNWIVNVLGSIEDKIELNRQTNQTLEQIAQALFKSWFVDFDPVKAKIAAKQAGANAEQIERAALCAISGKTPEQLAQLNPQILQQLKTTAALFPDALIDSELGKIPEGWKLNSLSDIAVFSDGRINVSELSLENYISTENMLDDKKGVSIASSLPNVKSVPSFNVGQILISNIRPYFKKIWLARFAGGRSNDVLGLQPIDSNCEEYLYNLLYQDEFFNFMMATSKGAKMPRGDKSAIMGWMCIHPSLEIKIAYTKSVESFYKRIHSSTQENEYLESLRDSLLPKLLSGQISIKSSQTLSGQMI